MALHTTVNTAFLICCTARDVHEYTLFGFRELFTAGAGQQMALQPLPRAGTQAPFHLDISKVSFTQCSVLDSQAQASASRHSC